MISLKNINKHFDTKQVLEQINWDIPKASIYGLVGPNGAGKSTLLRIISGVLKADDGPPVNRILQGRGLQAFKQPAHG